MGNPKDKEALQAFVEALMEQELEEVNAVGAGNVVGYTGPLGMDTKEGQKTLWSNPKEKGVDLNEGKLTFIGQCDKLRRGCEQNEELWQQMMAKAQPIPTAKFLKLADMSPLLDDDETPKDYFQSNPGIQAFQSVWGDQPAVFLQNAGFEFIFTKRDLAENVLDQMGQQKVGGAKRKEPYGTTYVGFSSGRTEDESGRARQADIVKKVNKNLDKKPYSLHDPPAMGISITRPSLKDRRNK